MIYTTLLFEARDGIAFITINRPDKLNALDSRVIDELGWAIDQVRKDSAIKGAILTGAGPKAFVAGADISQFQTLKSIEARRFSAKGSGIFRSIERSQKPFIAAVNGFALGGGCELAMACHIRVASDKAKFGQPEVKLGIPPGYGGTIRLPRLIGKGRAIELLTTGAMIDAAEAHRIGLVNHVYPGDQLLAEAEKLMRAILANAPLAVATCIDLVNAQDGMQMDDALNLESAMFAMLFESADAKEGAAAFLEKRAPNFQGK
ncbi:MAG: enoyl-CoA hydratase/isomerase family protein [Gemmatimonadales bacterium]